jgi:hypothetical protein
MYNDVSHECPRCKEAGRNGTGHGQISQIVLGFGGFSLTSLHRLKHQLEDNDLTPDQLKRVAECSADAWFTCEECDHTFKPDPAVLLAVSMLADRFVSESTADTLSRASALLRDIYPE